MGPADARNNGHDIDTNVRVIVSACVKGKKQTAASTTTMLLATSSWYSTKTSKISNASQ
jgi:hypothetical protein